MSWSTELFCNISFNRKTYNSKGEVESDLEETNSLIDSCKKTLRDYALMTEPHKFVEKDDNPYFTITSSVEETLKLLEEYIGERDRLLLLLENWDNCHNKEGLAIYPPDDIQWNTAYLHGDYINSTKYPKNGYKL